MPPLPALWRHGLTAASVLCSAAVVARAGETVPASPAAIRQELRSFDTVATILHIGAHPDDENTQLITYLARGRGYRTAYLSVTRGDGGQNLLGPQFDEKLGVARTEELLAARRQDGGRQFFTRAIDFGFSKNPEETLTIWDHEKVLSDVVRVIRQFRPDVVITCFPVPPGSGGHGHHTASAILAVEAFKLAGDPTKFPEQLKQGLTPWQPKRVLWSNRFGGRGANALKGPTITVDIGGADPVTGEDFGAIAGRSRAMHKTQGFDGFRASSGERPEGFMLLAGDPVPAPATGPDGKPLKPADFVDGIDITWAREPGGAEIGQMTDDAIAKFSLDNPGASVPALLAIRAKLATIAPDDPVVSDKRAQLDRILQACLGLSVQSLAAQPEVVPGGELSVALSVSVKADTPVTFTGTTVRNSTGSNLATNQPLHAGLPFTASLVIRPPANAPTSQPYWLRAAGENGIFHVDDPTMIGRPENPPAFPLQYNFEIGGQKFSVADEPIFLTGKTERRRRVDVVAPISLQFMPEVSLFAPGASRPVTVEATSATANADGKVHLELPDGWKAEPKTQDVHLAKAGDKTSVSFTVTAPAKTVSTSVTAAVEVKGQRYSAQRIAIDYAHLPPQLLQPPATAHIVSVAVATKGHRIGYLPGAGDSVGENLAQLGYEVTTLTGDDLNPGTLLKFDAVVIGVRAFNTRTDLVPHLAALFSYVEGGGTVVAQYNRPGADLKTDQLAPYPLKLSADRVTDEHAAMTPLVTDHPVLNLPNKITPADFDGWVQERGVYYPSDWDKQHFTAIFSAGDPGETPLESGLLIAKYGKGYYVYTGLAFFRQLPAGVPGAYRLFANLVSLGK